MKEAPERIWAFNAKQTGYRFYANGPQPEFDNVEYIRADLAVLPAVAPGVRVKPLQFTDEEGDGVLTSRETGELFRIFPQEKGGFCAPKLPEPSCWAADAQTLIDRLNARWQARILAALDTPAPAMGELVEALRFYADPETYHAILVLGDRPCGEFASDISDVDHEQYENSYGAKARAALAKIGGAA